MTNEIPVTFTLSRPIGWRMDGRIRLVVKCSTSGISFLELIISAEDWVSAQFGMAMVPGIGKVCGLNAVGKKKITETRSAICPVRSYNKKLLSKWLVEHCGEPGWTLDPYLGSQSSVVHQQDGTVRLNYKVHKWVDEPGVSS